MDVRDEMEWMATIHLDAEDGGNSKFYDLLRRKVEVRMETWRHVDDGGHLSSDDLTKLIQRGHGLLNHIEQWRTRHNPDGSQE